MREFSRVLVTGGAEFIRFRGGVGVAEGLSGGLQRWVCCGNPFMLVRVRPPTPTFSGLSFGNSVYPLM